MIQFSREERSERMRPSDDTREEILKALEKIQNICKNDVGIMIK